MSKTSSKILITNGIFIGFSRFKVELSRRIFQCFKCQQIGHSATNCRANQICVKCGGDHKHSACTSPTLKCANCQGSHAACSRTCSVIKQASAGTKKTPYYNPPLSYARIVSHGNKISNQEIAAPQPIQTTKPTTDISNLNKIITETVSRLFEQQMKQLVEKVNERIEKLIYMKLEQLVKLNVEELFSTKFEALASKKNESLSKQEQAPQLQQNTKHSTQLTTQKPQQHSKLQTSHNPVLSNQLTLPMNQKNNQFRYE